MEKAKWRLKMNLRTRICKTIQKCENGSPEANRKKICLSNCDRCPENKAYQRLLIMGIDSYFTFVLGFEDTQNTKNRFAMGK